MKRAFSLILVLVMMMSMLGTACGQGETGTEEPEVTVTAEPEVTTTVESEAAETEAPEATETGAPEATETEAPEATETGAPEATEIGVPEATKTEAPEATETGAPEATETGVPEATETGSPEATETGVPEATETEAPEATETGAPEATETEATEATETGVPEATETGAPEATETEAPEATETGSPEATETGAPEATETGAPDATETGTPEATETGTPEATETGVPDAAETGAPEATETGVPEATETGAPEATETEAPAVTPTPIAEPTPDVCEHQWEDREPIRSTCLWEGEERQQCAKCGRWNELRKIPMLTDHVAPDPVYVQDCWGEGHQRICEICQVSQPTEDWVRYDEPKHEWEITGYSQQATCVREGGYQQKCTKCGEYRFVGTGKLTDHEPPEAVPFEDCEGKGTKQTCTICNESYRNYTERYDPPKHEFTERRGRIATCLRQGYEESYCSKCEKWLRTKDIPKLTDHEPPEAVPFEECRGKGTEQKCTICNDSNKIYTERYDTPKHEWENTGVFRSASCLNEGGYAQVCTKCGAYDFVVTANKRTDHEPPEVVPYEDCWGKGTQQKCNICNDIIAIITEWFNPPKHEWENTDHTQQATCLHEGGYEQMCTKCGEEQIVATEDKRTDHEPPEAVPFEDCWGKGIEQKCDICNDTTADIIEWYDSPKHELSDYSLADEPTCMREGSVTKYCGRCDSWIMVESQPIRTDHAKPQPVPFVDCFGEGLGYWCDICQSDWMEYQKRYSEPKHEFTETKTEDANCMWPGGVSKYCSKCDRWHSVDPLPIRTDHEAPDYSPFEDCYGKGLKRYCEICAVGNEIYDVKYDPPKHDFVLVGDEYICSHCDEHKENPPESDVTPEPTAEPTPVPTAEPTAEPTSVPTAEPTAEPTSVPTAEPTADPTTVPTAEPTAEPTLVPPVEPTAEPTSVPTAKPTAEPTPVPTAEPTAEPTPVPTAKPTAKPTPVPTAEPTAEPTATPEPIVEAVQDIVNSSFEEQEDEMSAKPEVVVEKDDTGAVSVTIITPSSVADDTSTEIGEQDSSAESDAKEPQSVNLTAEVITSLSENAVSNVVLQDAESNTQVQMKDMAAVIEEIKTENAESIVVEFDKTAAITAMEKNHEAVKDYEVTNVCNIAVKLISGGEEKTISNNVKGLTVRWNGLKTEADQVILFISADGTIIELEAVWVEGENGADSYWEIPYAGAGTYVLANHIEASK